MISRRCSQSPSALDPEPLEQTLPQEIAALENPLTDAYLAITIAAPDAPIFVQGYSRLFPNDLDMGCEFIRSDDTVFLNEMTSELDAVIRRAAENAGVTYVDVYEAFAGHELCTGQSYLHGIDKSDSAFKRDAFFHPNVAGQGRYRDLLLDAIGGREPVQAMAAGSRPTMTVDVTTVRASSSFSFIADGYAPNAEVEVVLDWGSASPSTQAMSTADGEGRVSAAVIIPDTTPIGVHSVTAWGVNGDGHHVGPTVELTVAEAPPAGSE